MKVEKALVVADPWIGYLLNGSKTWEMRSQKTAHRGWMGLIRKGSGTVVGIARPVEVGSPLSLAEMIESEAKHRIPARMIESGEVAKWNTPWKLADIKPLSRPVPYVHKPGAVTWVNLDPSVQQEIEHQLGRMPFSSSAGGDAASASGVGPGKPSPSSDVKISVNLEERPHRPAKRKGFWGSLLGSQPSRRNARTLTIDVEWDDGKPEQASPTDASARRELKGPRANLPARPAAAEESVRSRSQSARRVGEVQLTDGNIRNGHIYLRAFFDRFPPDAVGGSNKSSLADGLLTVETGAGNTFETDLDGSKRFFRARGPIKAFFTETGAKAGDFVCIDEVSPYRYRLTLKRA